MTAEENGSVPGEWVWLFHGESAFTVSGVFTSREKAESWIRQYGLSGILTRMPMDVSAYAWAVREGVFTPKQPSQESGKFVGGFTSASLEHYHYENGVNQA